MAEEWESVMTALLASSGISFQVKRFRKDMSSRQSGCYRCSLPHRPARHTERRRTQKQHTDTAANFLSREQGTPETLPGAPEWDLPSEDEFLSRRKTARRPRQQASCRNTSGNRMRQNHERYKSSHPPTLAYGLKRVCSMFVLFASPFCSCCHQEDQII